MVSARNVMVQGGQGSQSAGAVLGGVAGAALGQTGGQGPGQDVATGGRRHRGRRGRAAGGARGGRARSIEWTVRLESGQTIAVIQATPVFAIGQRVQVISGGGTTRLAAA